MKLALEAGGEGEAGAPVLQRVEASIAERKEESRTESGPSMEEIFCDRQNLVQALKRVRRNKGKPGIDGMTVEELEGHLRRHWPQIREALLEGRYRPAAVRRALIEKLGGGWRKLGIPTCLDRFIQQAILQVLIRYWRGRFSDYSYGFMEGRSAHDAIAQAKHYMREGYRVVIDLDLESFFDRVSHDRLMSRLAERIKDKRLLKLIRAYLESGVLEGGVVSPTREGTPQGGPLSPFLSNVVLDELDRELERRGHRFARYADDCNIYVKTWKAGERVAASVRRFIEGRLKLKVNEAKSAIDRPWKRKFLGFTFTNQRAVKARISPKSLERFRNKVRRTTRWRKGRSLEAVVEELNPYLRGWRGYYGRCDTPTVFPPLDRWVRRRLRCLVWKQWKTPKRRREQLVRGGVSRHSARRVAGSRQGPWIMSHTKHLQIALDDAFFTQLGLVRLAA
jgi:RNA-directed DNA polymerase